MHIAASKSTKQNKKKKVDVHSGEKKKIRNEIKEKEKKNRSVGTMHGGNEWIREFDGRAQR